MNYTFNIQKLYSLYTQSSGVSIDTRTIVPNAIFFAIKGERFNGNRFAEQAIALGASFVVVDEEIVVEDERIFIVPNGLEALQQLAHYHRKQFKATIVAITGSNGKTTTKELLYSIFSRHYNTFATPGNYNNHIGLPISILLIKPYVEFAILEMGDNQIGDIALLSEISAPDAALITNLGLDHIGNYTSMQENYHSKIELFDYIVASGGTYFKNDLDEELSKLVYWNSIGFGHANAIAAGKVIASAPDGLTVQLTSNRWTEPVQLHSPLAGQYNLENIVAAAAVAIHYEVPKEVIIEGIESYQPKNNRSQFLNIGFLSVVLDAYNANPSSVSLALKSFAELEGRKAVIIGDMLELGQYSRSEHEKIGHLIASLGIECLIGIGAEMNYAVSAARGRNTIAYHYLSVSGCLNDLPSILAHIDLLLVKGSRAMKLESVIETLRTHFEGK
jgi:UDP-N-acetylmuramoyl-tripeptide--D-alanyl-D-alanine ligase